MSGPKSNPEISSSDDLEGSVSSQDEMEQVSLFVRGCRQLTVIGKYFVLTTDSALNLL